jgi:FHS family L-fucose permease-like MFS transporter
MSIVGGALIPPIAAALFKVSTSAALVVPLICFAFIVYYSYTGYKISTKTVN